MTWQARRNAKDFTTPPIFTSNFIKKTCGLTVCVTCVWAGVDNAWEQGKLEARKMLVNRADSHTSGARFVGWLCARHAD